MNCSEALLEGVPKYAREIGLNPLDEEQCKLYIEIIEQIRPHFWNICLDLDISHLLLLTEFVLIVEKFK